MTTYLITGGTGTLGNALVKRLLAQADTERIRIYSRDEHKQEEMAARFSDSGIGGKLRYIIGDVRDLAHLERACTGVDYVIHAAALKRIDTVEYNVPDAMATNVDGTKNVVLAAAQAGVRTVVFVSSDKACEPLNCYGKTKALAESIVMSATHWLGRRDTRFCCVRYGNVMASRGSFLAKLLEWRAAGVCVPVTHKDMTRFWITIDDAVDLIMTALDAGGHGHPSGCLYVPLAQALAVKDIIDHFYPSAQIKVTGMRPGEKMHECMVSMTEALAGLYLLPASSWSWSRYDIAVVPSFVQTLGVPLLKWDDARPWYSDEQIDKTDGLLTRMAEALHE